MKDIHFIVNRKTIRFLFTAWLIVLLKSQAIQAQPLMELSYEDACQAVKNHSALRENPLILSEIAKMATQNIHSTWLPQAFLNAQATWQSEVTRVQIPIPGISLPEIPQDQYKLSAEISQLIYNGNTSVYRRNLELLQQKANTLDVEMQLDLLEQQVDALFFQIQTLRRQQNILQWQTKTLEARLQSCEKRRINGMSTSGDCALLEAAILQVAQKQTETRFSHASAIQQLSMLTGLNLNDSVKILFPDFAMRMNNSIYNRKDLNYLGVKQEMADAQIQLALSRKKPQANAFLNAGMGRPGLNMLDPDFQPWLMTGIRLSLPLLQWGIPDRDARIAGLQKQLTIHQQENLLQSLDRKNAELDSEIKKTEEIIENDRKLLVLRQQITTEAQSQYDNGVLPSSEFTARMAEEAEARLNLEIHQLQLEYVRLKKYKLFNNQ
jgi:outer membrane protein TolC